MIGLAIGLVVAESRAGATETGVQVIPTTLPSTTVTLLTTTTTLPSVTTLATTLTETALPGSSPPTTTLPPSEQAESEDSGTLDVISGAIISHVPSLCTLASDYLEADLGNCRAAAAPTMGAEEPGDHTGGSADQKTPSPKTEQEQEIDDEEEKSQQEESPASDEETTDEVPPDLLQRLLDLVDDLLNRGDTEVAGSQLLATTGLAILRMAATATVLLLAGLGIRKISSGG